MELRDYDSRSALHLAAAEGKQLSHTHSVIFMDNAAFSDCLYFRSCGSCEVLNRDMQSESSC